MKQSYAQDILLQLINNSDCHFHQVFEIIDSSSVCVFLMAEWDDNQGHILHVLLHNAKYDTMFVRFFFTEIEDVIPSFRDVVFINEVECCISQPSFRSDLKKIIKSQRGYLSVEEKQYITQ